ncbi:hypothetical protein [Bradyrhizobium sp. Gha]|uniref:hypothetical protein n=1 Tax=Bradyrhizobium sp. Gha TaxID=1855318 RepID=UPI0008F13367|nr:hypothetical protein [Bradyrhizobium sp. Gha]SFJ85439.1 hypothetical protein SAMN05216525_13919 [Bradyrhizobium sp. Gha]
MRNAVPTARQRGGASAKSGQSVAPAARSQSDTVTQIDKLIVEGPPAHVARALTSRGPACSCDKAFLVRELETKLMGHSARSETTGKAYDRAKLEAQRRIAAANRCSRYGLTRRIARRTHSNDISSLENDV